MEQSATPNASFQDRLARLSAGQQNRPAETVEPETLMSRVTVASMKAQEAEDAKKRELRTRGDVSALPDWRENVKYPLSFIKAALMGMFGAFFGKYVAITMFSGGESTQFNMLGYYMELGVAFAAALMIKEIFRIKGEHLRKAQLVGVIFMVGMVHNLAFWMPGVMSALYSTQWVERTTEMATPNSYMFRGNYFVFSQDDKPKKPKVIRR